MHKCLGPNSTPSIRPSKSKPKLALDQGPLFIVIKNRNEISPQVFISLKTLYLKMDGDYTMFQCVFGVLGEFFFTFKISLLALYLTFFFFFLNVQELFLGFFLYCQHCEFSQSPQLFAVQIIFKICSLILIIN